MNSQKTIRITGEPVLLTAFMQKVKKHGYRYDGPIYHLNNPDMYLFPDGTYKLCEDPPVWHIQFNLPEQWNEAVEALNDPKPEIKVGDWILTTIINAWGIITNINNKGDSTPYEIRCVNFNTIHVPEKANIGLIPSEIKILTEAEVLELFKAEAKERGLVFGATYTSPSCTKPQRMTNLHLIFTHGHFQEGGYILWSPSFGWVAEVVKEEIIEIGGEKVMSHGTDFISIGEHSYGVDELIALRTLITCHSSQIKSINVGCSGQYKVDLNLLNKILKRLGQ